VRALAHDYERKHANEYNLKPSTLAEYRRQMDALVAAYGDLPLALLDESHVADYLGACSPGSLPSRFSFLAAFLRWADRRIRPGLAALVPERKPARRWRTRHLSVVEVRRVLEWIRVRRTMPRARPATLDAVELGIVCPLRRSEIVTLQTHEVDLEASRLFLHDTKSGNRVVPISGIARAICRRRMLSAPGTHLFPARARGGHMLPESLSHAWCRIARACGLDGVPFHCWRHTWASNGLLVGLRLEYVRRVMGHTTEWMTVKYAHLDCAELQQAVDGVEALYREGGQSDA
jgi:integrase